MTRFPCQLRLNLKAREVVRSFADHSSKSRPCGFERSTRPGAIAKTTGDDCLIPFLRSEETIVVELVASRGSEYLFSGVIITLF